ncbi:MAG: hypothetical protein ACRDS0_38350, partial [Pseudonocardiaceae bacterium]
DGTAPTETWNSGPGNWDWTRTAWLVGDFAGDGKAQIAAMYNYPDTRTALWMFPSDGTAPTETWNSGPGNWDWTRTAWLVGDFAGDGKAQIAAMYNYGSS